MPVKYKKGEEKMTMTQLGMIIDNLYAYFALTFMKVPLDVLSIIESIMKL